MSTGTGKQKKKKKTSDSETKNVLNSKSASVDFTKILLTGEPENACMPVVTLWAVQSETYRAQSHVIRIPYHCTAILYFPHKNTQQHSKCKPLLHITAVSLQHSELTNVFNPFTKH
jgi:hypothetical protein